MDELLKGACERLKVPENASIEDVKEAYRALVDARIKGHERWEEIKEIDSAFQTLKAHLLSGAAPQPERPQEEPVASPGEDGSLINRAKELLFPPVEHVNTFSFWARVLFFLIILVWGIKFIVAPIQGDYIGRSFMHLINLPFHEAGHMIFSVLGDFMRVLGGTIMQILIPAICMIAFIKGGDPFGASFALWWAGQSFIDVAPYIYDARAGELMLLGGVTGQDAPDCHDWHNMLERLGLLSCDHVIAYLSKYTGALLILLALVLCSYTLLRQYRSLKGR
ncbi:MAG: zinc ribbon domain-containing protein [Syntrophus sp. (in: bacteria)]|nr:zinc ribbon domain-containing protein [Syntrophus sp. (in: bacteria)]